MPTVQIVIIPIIPPHKCMDPAKLDRTLLKRDTSLQHCFYTWKVLTLQTVITPVVLAELVFISPSLTVLMVSVDIKQH